MRRRDFITVLGGAASWPLAARAQQRQTYRVSILLGASTENSEEIEHIETLFQGLGWTPQRDLEIEYRWGAGQTELNTFYAKAIIAKKPDAILAITNSAMAALHREASTIPTVFLMVSDPVGMQYVDSFAKPGGNVTGFTPFEPSLGGKWVSILKEIAPKVQTIGLMFNPEPGNNSASFSGPIKSIASSLGVTAIEKPTGDAADVERLISKLGQQANGGLIFLPDAFTFINRDAIIASIAHNRLPAIYPLRGFCDAGGLISYGIKYSQLLEQSVTYVSRILRGAKPAELPVQGPTTFELIINQKAAKELDLPIPTTLLARADEVIE